MFVYISKARHRTVTHKESSKKVYEVFSPETLEQIDTYGDDSAIRIGPWWVESSGDVPIKNIFFH